MTTSDSSIARQEMQERIEHLRDRLKGYATEQVAEAEANLQKALKLRDEIAERLASWEAEVAKLDGPNMMASVERE